VDSGGYADILWRLAKLFYCIGLYTSTNLNIMILPASVTQCVC